MACSRDQIAILFFQVLCTCAAIVLGMVCILEFRKDEDLTEVSFKRFHEDEESIYPEISICISDAYLEDRLKSIGDGINAITYEKFLEGELWDERMSVIDYNNVTKNIKDYLLGTCIKKEFNGNCKPFNASITTFVNQIRKCFTIHNPKKTSMMFVEAKLNASLFPQFIRPLGFRFVLRFPFPNQLFRSAVSAFGNWPDRVNKPKSFLMDFRMSNVQVVKRRDKPSKRCYDWKKYDRMVFEDILQEVGCTPVYWNKNSSLPACKDKTKMKALFDKFYEKYFPIDPTIKNIPPCIEAQYVQIGYKDLPKDNLETKKPVDQNNGVDKGDWFKIRLWYRSTTYMEIKQVEAYTFESLVGNGGGYVGLFLGYSLSQLPHFMIFLLSSLRKIVTTDCCLKSYGEDDGKNPDRTPVISYHGTHVNQVKRSTLDGKGGRINGQASKENS